MVYSVTSLKKKHLFWDCKVLAEVLVFWHPKGVFGPYAVEIKLWGGGGSASSRSGSSSSHAGGGGRKSIFYCC